MTSVYFQKVQSVHDILFNLFLDETKRDEEHFKYLSQKISDLQKPVVVLDQAKKCLDRYPTLLSMFELKNEIIVLGKRINKNKSIEENAYRSTLETRFNKSGSLVGFQAVLQGGTSINSSYFMHSARVGMQLSFPFLQIDTKSASLYSGVALSSEEHTFFSTSVHTPSSNYNFHSFIDFVRTYVSQVNIQEGKDKKLCYLQLSK